MTFRRVLAVVLLFSFAALMCAAQTTDNPNNPTWWDKYNYIRKNGPSAFATAATTTTKSSNVDVSNECGPQSETYITIDAANSKILAGGSNEIYRLPMRGYFSFNGGSSWGGVDLPLPGSQGANSYNFGSDPTLAYDRFGNLYYGYIVVYFGSGNGVNGSGMAVARSQDFGQSYAATFFGYLSGSNHFNDKPMITTGPNPADPTRDNVYIAWDAASGGSTGGGIRVATSSDSAATFTITRADDPSGPGRSIGAIPFVGADNTLWVAWNDYTANAIMVNSSADGGATWGSPQVISYKTLPFQANIPAESFRGALVYPSCGADRSAGPFRGRLYCSWMDMGPNGSTDIYLSHFTPGHDSSWSAPQAVTDQIGVVDRFNHWMAVDAVTGDVNVSFYDTRNDTTGARYMTDVYFTQSQDGGTSFRSPNTRVTTASSNEHDCAGVFPCAFINYGNQQGDYEGLASYNGISHPIWTDSRNNSQTSSSCHVGAMEEVFSATVK